MRWTSLDTLPDDGTPRKVAVIADRTDAWNRFVNEPIGNVFLRRAGQTGEVVALQVVCPHAGCSINYQATDAGGKFFCPCHAASFDLTGSGPTRPRPARATWIRSRWRFANKTRCGSSSRTSASAQQTKLHRA